MAHTTTTISAPVTMPDDFSAVMGIAGTDLGDICMSPVTNMWAKWKAVPYAQVETLPDSVRAAMNYGIINIPTWSNILKMANFWLGIDTTSTNAPDIGIKPIYWGYRTPAGGASEPYRLTDWSNAAKTSGYYHEAEAPIGGSRNTSYTIDSSGNLRILFQTGAEDARTIKLSELTYPTAGYSIANMYFGVIMKKQGSSTIYAVTGHKFSEFTSLGAYVDISGLDASYNGNWDIFPMASADQISFTGSLSGYVNGKFIALNEKETVGIGATVVRMDSVPGTFYAYRDTATSNRILYTGFTIKNVNNSQRSASVLFEVFNASNTLLASNTKTVTAVNVGDTARVIGNVDMSTLANLRSAYSVRITITPTNVSNYALSYDTCTVSNGPSPDA